MWFTDRARRLNFDVVNLSFVNNKETRILLNLSADMCIMPSTLPWNLHCPREHTNHIAQQCVAKYITANTCKAAGGRWTKFITNIVERTSGILSTCYAMGDMKLKRGIPYQPHKVSQGADEPLQYVLVLEFRVQVPLTRTEIQYLESGIWNPESVLDSTWGDLIRKSKTKTKFCQPARLSTPPKPLFSLKPLDATTWLRSLLSEVFHLIHETRHLYKLSRNDGIKIWPSKLGSHGNVNIDDDLKMFPDRTSR